MRFISLYIGKNITRVVSSLTTRTQLQHYKYALYDKVPWFAIPKAYLQCKLTPPGHFPIYTAGLNECYTS